MEFCAGLQSSGEHMPAKRTAALLSAALSLAGPSAIAQDASPIVFTNVDVFDGVNETLTENANVVIEGNLISRVSTEPVDLPGATVIDGGGRTMIPGLIDVHSHTS